MTDKLNQELSKCCVTSIVTMINVMTVNIRIMNVSNKDCKAIMKSNLYSVIPIGENSIKLIDMIVLSGEIIYADKTSKKEFEFSIIEQLYEFQDMINTMFSKSIDIDKPKFLS